MLWNTAAGKVVAGPANTLNEETINILTPQAKLTAANAKIEWLQELLEAKDTPATPDNPLDRLAMVFKALAQHTTLLKSAKVADPLLLTDRTNPTFNNWKFQLQDKLKINKNHFPNN